MKSVALAICCMSWLTLCRSAVEVCSTPGCVELANILRNNMDLSVPPCEDFYHFSCGGLLNSTTIPEAEAAFGVSEEVDLLIRKELRKELEAKTIKGQPPAFQNAKDFYRSCMDEATIERRGLTDMKRKLQTYGGWPVLDPDWDETRADWVKTTQRMGQAGNYADQIIDVYIDVSDGNHTTREIKLGSAYHAQSDYVLLRGESNDVFRAYSQMLVDSAVAFGACPQRARREITEALQFEVQLVNISQQYTGSKLMNVSELQVQFPYVQWLPYIQTLFGQSFTKNEMVRVYNPSYFIKLGKLLDKTPKRVILNHIMNQLIYIQSENMNQHMLDIKQKLTKVKFGKTSLPVRWEFCLGKIWGLMDDILGAAYVRKYFSPESKQKATDLTKVLQEQFARLIEEKEEWMDSETRARAAEKVRSIKDMIGYPEELLDDMVLNAVYKKLTISKTDLLDNVLSIQKWQRQRNTDKLRLPVDPNAWDQLNLVYVTIDNANYMQYTNKISVFAATLQRNFFRLDRPDVLNYATLSTTVGHELTHSVDNLGRQYNKDGVFVNWWTKFSEDAFNNKTQALIDEYSTYYVKEINETLNGNNIQGEMIADHGGYKLARAAMDSWLTAHPAQDLRLGGLEEYTVKQMFWLAAANTWCTKYRPEFFRRLVEENEHPPVEFRVNGPFRNSEQFAADWACPVGSHMNPEYKVNVW